MATKRSGDPMVEGEPRTNGKHDGHSGDEAAAKQVYIIHDNILNRIERNWEELCYYSQLSSIVVCGYIKLVGVFIA